MLSKNSIYRSLSTVITTYPSIQERHRALNARVRLSTIVPDCLCSLVEGVLLQCVQACYEPSMGAEDAYELFNLMKDHGGPWPEFLQDQFVPIPSR